MRTQTSLVDLEELFYLALNATQTGRYEQAINYLRQVLEQEPGNGKAFYLLGAVHAQLGLYERAIEEMQQAVEREPQLEAAHFQLGMLHLHTGNFKAAETAWEKLNVLGNNHYLYLFKEGLIALSNDQYDECIRLLNIGIEQNQINESLNQDMQNIIASTQNLLSTNDNTDESSNPDDMQDASLDTATGKRIILSAYQKNQTPNDSSH